MKKVLIAKVKKKLAKEADTSNTTFGYLRCKWAQFETWFQTTYLPGLKTRIALYSTFIGATATTLKEQLPSLPLDKYVSASTLGIVTMVLALLALWFNKMHNQVEARVEDIR